MYRNNMFEVNNIRSRPVYFAKEIKKAIKGLGTDEHTLNRIFVSRCEVDMKQIKIEYEKVYNVSLEKDVQDDVSGDYGKLLLSLSKDPSQRHYDPVNIGDNNNIIVPTEPHVYEEVVEPTVEETPTLRPVDGFNPNSDCEGLRKAMKGLGTDEKAIIAILCKRSNDQRLQLKDTYTKMFSKDLVKELHSELSGHFRDIILGLMMRPADFDAWSFNKAIKVGC
jgi:annexin A6